MVWLTLTAYVHCRPPKFLRQGLVVSPGNGDLCAANATVPSSFKLTNSSGGATSLQDCAPFSAACVALCAHLLCMSSVQPGTVRLDVR